MQSALDPLSYQQQQAVWHQKRSRNGEIIAVNEFHVITDHQPVMRCKCSCPSSDQTWALGNPSQENVHNPIKSEVASHVLCWVSPGSPRVQQFKELKCYGESVRGSCCLQLTLLLASGQMPICQFSRISWRQVQDRWCTPFMTDPLSESWKWNKWKSCCRKRRERNGKDVGLFTCCKCCSLLCTEHHS